LISGSENKAPAYNFEDVLSKLGSRGEEVTQIQAALKNFGYYLDGIDGVFGVKTQEALMRFQEARGFTADGIAGTQTLKALGLQIDIQTANNENGINLLARLISAEARGEPYAAQVAVGAVILNRVKHASFPNSISAVIYQPDAFASIKNGRFDQPVSESAFRAARDALNNIDPSGGAVYFYNPKSSSANQAFRDRPVIASIGSFAFS
jgi:N-acetylmuramoyl-L-alanine amidase